MFWEHGWDSLASISLTFTRSLTLSRMSNHLNRNFRPRMINLVWNFERVVTTSNIDLLMKACALFDNLFSLVYPSPMLIPLSVADRQSEQLGIYQSGVKQCRVTGPLKHYFLPKRTLEVCSALKNIQVSDDSFSLNVKGSITRRPSSALGKGPSR